MAIHIGIDPGFGGGLAVLTPDSAPLLYDLPVMVVEGSTKDHTEYDLRALAKLLGDLGARGFCQIALEFVRGIPRRPGKVGREAPQRVWLQGHGVGVIEGVIAGLGLPYERVSPQRWRKALGAPGGVDAKEASRLLALQLFPGAADQLARKKDHGRAEALLIAEWLRRTTNGQ